MIADEIGFLIEVCSEASFKWDMLKMKRIGQKQTFTSN